MAHGRVHWSGQSIPSMRSTIWCNCRCLHLWIWICFSVSLWVLATMLPCAMGRNDVSDLHLFFQSFSVINFEQDLPRWVRARARRKGFKIDWFTARARGPILSFILFLWIIHSWCGAANKGLECYLRLYSDRLVFDCCQNPTKRPRMSSSAGVLQTLTTGCSSLWSTSKKRTIRVLTCFHCSCNILSAVCVCVMTWLNLRWIGASFCSWPSSWEEDCVSSWRWRIENRQAEPLCIVQLVCMCFAFCNQGQMKNHMDQVSQWGKLAGNSMHLAAVSHLNYSWFLLFFSVYSQYSGWSSNSCRYLLYCFQEMMWPVANQFGLSLQHSSVDQCNNDACSNHW